MLKEFFSGIAILLTFAAFIPYIYSILYKNVRPHVFSWIIWGSTTFIVFTAQLADGGGAGAWPIGISGLLSLIVAILAYVKRADHSITKSDWIFLMLAAMSIPIWFITEDPMWAVIILTSIDLLGFGPTFRKAYQYPFEEQLTFYVIFVIRNTFALFALQYYSIATMLFPLATAIASSILCIVILQRRNISQ